MMPNDQLNCFTQPAILKAIGRVRLAMFLETFAEDLKATNILLPPPEPENDDYFSALATAFACAQSLPHRLRKALFTLEEAASPKNHERLQEAIKRRIPCVAVSEHCALDRALELWFAVPDELEQFANSIHQSIDPVSIIQNPASAIQNPVSAIQNPLYFQPIEPWPEPVDGKLLLDAIAAILRLFVVLPKWALETLALWILHTYAFELRDVTTYLGIESPEKRCGKTTLLRVFNKLVSRPLPAANISPPAFFRAIQDMRPTLLIDEADTFLRRSEELRGILNGGYGRDTAFVMRVAPQAPSAASADGAPSREPDQPNILPTPHSALPIPHSTPGLATFSCWCPKAIATIGHLPDTLADRCILIRMQRKTSKERCERLKNLDATAIRRQCVRFVLDHQAEIAAARPQIPPGLNDRAADIWEPLLVLADLAGGQWPELARQAAVGLTASAQQSDPIGSLLLDIFVLFTTQKVDRLFTRQIVESLNASPDRPWAEMRNGKEVNDQWLSNRLRPYGIEPRTLRIGELRAKGYFEEDFKDAFRRYISKADLDALLSESKPNDPPPNSNGPPDANPKP